MTDRELLQGFKQKRDIIKDGFRKILTLGQDKNPALKFTGEASTIQVMAGGFSWTGRCHTYSWAVNGSCQHHKHRAGGGESLRW